VARSLSTGKDEVFKFEIPRAKLVYETGITMEADGDPSVFGFKIKPLKTDDGVLVRLTRIGGEPERIPSEGLAFELTEDQ
jgi:hypothetical protein